MELKAPIPGENLVADGRNYPWRRAPELVDYDEAVESILNKVDEDVELEAVFAMMDVGADMVTITSTLLLNYIGMGKVSIDLALLMAGPLSRYLEIKAKKAGVDFDLGLVDENRKPITAEDMRMAMGIVQQDEEEETPVLDLPQETPEEEALEDSLMAQPPVASEEEQSSMLGMDEKKKKRLLMAKIRFSDKIAEVQGQLAEGGFMDKPTLGDYMTVAAQNLATGLQAAEKERMIKEKEERAEAAAKAERIRKEQLEEEKQIKKLKAAINAALDIELGSKENIDWQWNNIGWQSPKLSMIFFLY